jgi:hypothetical protein
VGDTVYFHMTNLEQDWDVVHGIGVKGANNAEILVAPGADQDAEMDPHARRDLPLLLHGLLLRTPPGDAGIRARLAPRGGGADLLRNRKLKAPNHSD